MKPKTKRHQRAIKRQLQRIRERNRKVRLAEFILAHGMTPKQHREKHVAEAMMAWGGSHTGRMQGKSFGMQQMIEKLKANSVQAIEGTKLNIALYSGKQMQTISLPGDLLDTVVSGDGYTKS
jgi:hypothetical protein